MTGCPQEDSLLLLVRGQLPAAEAPRLHQHIDQCPDCHTLVVELSKTLLPRDVSARSQGPQVRPLEAEGHPPEARAPQPPPPHLDEYRLVRPLGRGAMGQVWLGIDTLLDRPVAIKWLAAPEPDEASKARFRVEAQAIARLHHPNVVAIYRFGEADGRHYLVSEFVRGEGLDRLRKPIPMARALLIAIGLSRGLAAAHRRGVLHRDIKPANVVLAEDGEVKLLDFGLAKLLGRPPRAEDAQEQFLRGAGEAPSVTQTGSLLGTPLYLAPELWQGEAATRKSDIYAMGALLYELCTGLPPHQGATLEALAQRVKEQEPQPIPAAAEDAPFAAIIERCVRRDPAQRFEAGDALREALEKLTVAGPVGAALPAGSPYLGLRAFDAEHRDLFFGRGPEARALLDRLRAQPFLLVAGDSGVGKSSLCHAGVLPAVREGALGGRWLIAQMLPGRHPLRALCVALSPLLDEDQSVLAEGLRSDPVALSRRLRRQLGDGQLLLFVDQLEEIFTIAAAEEAAAFGEVLATLLARAPHLRLLCTVRGDFLTRLGALLGLGARVQESLFLLAPLSAAGLREAICGPAERKGYRFESPELVAELLSAAAGGLPLLQFALHALWERRDEAQRLIPAAALQALGGVGGALARHADGVVAGLPPAQRRQVRHLLGQLVTAEGTRLRRSEVDLRGGAGSSAALEALLRGRLVVASTDEDGRSIYEIAHEALLPGWDTLRGWLADDGALRVARQRLERAAAEWERIGKDRGALWAGRHLLEAASLPAGDLTPREAAFLRASRRALWQGRLRRGVALLGVPLCLALGYGGLLLKQRADRGRAVDEQLARGRALLDEARARDRELEAERRRAFTLFDSGQREAGEATWEALQPLVGEVRALHEQAAHAADLGRMLDGRRRDARELFATLLYERARLAERLYRHRELDELLRSLAAFDPGSALLSRFAAPVQLRIESAPAGAEVSLERFVDGEKGRLRRERLSDLGRTPLAAVALAPGSYLLAFTAPGRGPVSYPVLIGRGEALAIALPLPAAAQVPAGFVYVPAGRFLVGSAAEEDARRWLGAVPLHEARTGPFLIARQETTFSDWLAYLQALAKEERAVRMPRAGSLNQHGAIALVQLGDGAYQLTLQPTMAHSYRARAGEPIRYERGHRAVQDWLRLPVSGVSLADARAYAAWLHASGRVPGARLCAELEWERAARGADDREYPHGSRLFPDDANHDRTYGKEPGAFGPDEVGSHPASRSPFGVDDLAGNVWEWVSASLAPGDARAVLRGGSFYVGDKSTRSTNRQVPEPTYRDSTVGLRICAAAER